MEKNFDYEIRPARIEDAGILAPKLREIDCREVRAMSRQEPAEALRRSLEVSSTARAAVIEGQVGLMWGIGRLGGFLGFVGSPWMLSSDIIERPDVAREFIRRSRPQARELEAGFRRLENWVHVENAAAIRWLKWLGFSFSAEPALINGEAFYHFWRNCAGGTANV